MSNAGAVRRENRLIHETSPYLLQHAHNPVDWYPWGPEALARARSEDRPILLSIGYSACHWCHVMERESFEDEAIAALMNARFVCIKVDREERPDLDDIYMAATVAMSGSGGWPMTVFLTPEQQPFFAGTYFPPSDKYGRPGFPTLLQKIADAWRDDREALLDQARELTAHLLEATHSAPPGSLGAELTDAAATELANSYDPRFGGFGSAPKFPPCGALSLLLRMHRRDADPHWLELVTGTLDGMMNGGIYDHVGGGFCRYSTDERWLAPHFEKMLYDNAQLARVYVEAWQVTKKVDYARVATETLDYVLAEMTGEGGGFFSATDADSEGVEGKFFVWQPAELVSILGAGDARQVSAYYDITTGGNWEHASIPNTPRDKATVARELAVSEAELTTTIERCRPLLYAARAQRVPPLTDDKVLVSWNGLMIGALAEGHRALGNARWLEAAERAARFVLAHLVRPDGGLYRTARAGRAHLDAYLEDYAFLVDALVDVVEAGGDMALLADAERLADRMIVDFGDDAAGAFHHTARGHERLLIRPREGHDGAIPNPNAVAARGLARLSVHVDRDDLRERASAAVRAYGRLAERAPRAFVTTLGVADFLMEGPVELVVVGAPTETAALRAEIGRHYLPQRVIAHVDPGRPGPTRPLSAGKAPVDGRAALYVCRNFACKSPITEPGDVAAALAEGRRAALESRSSTLTVDVTPGYATVAATAALSQAQLAARPDGYSLLGRTGLSVSRIGFGGYRIDDGDPEHRAALEKALRSGINLVDTSTNYTEGRSERVIGEVIGEFCRRGELSRGAVVIVSKIGYVQGPNLKLSREREAAGQPFPEMVKLGEALWHCLHPAWLEDQLGRSLERLALETLDVCLLHNPEYYLKAEAERGALTLEQRRDEFYRRIAGAFEQLEREVQRGRIRAYGVSSNTVAGAENDPETTSLSRLLEAATRAAGDAHHFRVLQLPLNLIEARAAGLRSAREFEEPSVLDEAREHGLAVLVNRPLNAIVARGIFRLADPPSVPPGGPFEAARADVERLEQEFRQQLAPSVRVAPGSAPVSRLFEWATQLAAMPARIESLEQWREIEAQVIGPRVGHALAQLDRALSGDVGKAWREFRQRYLTALERLLDALRARAFDRSRARCLSLARAIDPLLPEARRSDPLAQKALATLLGTPGVDVVLLGARDRAYVDDALAVLRHGPAPDGRRILEAVATASLPGV